MTLSLHQDFYDRQRLKKMLDSKEWPEAIPEAMLEPQDKSGRASTILHMMVGSHLLRKTKNLLDFGCGTGETVRLAPEYGAKNATGYDIRPAKGVITNFGKVRDRGPYDVVVVNDVFDHLVGETLQSVVAKIHSVIDPESRVFIRCHPYSARAGTHLPCYGINKAYAHFFFPELKGEHTNFIPAPLDNYRIAFRNNGMYIERELIHRQGIEDFFKKDKQIWLLMQKKIRSPNFLWDLRIQYVEFTLQQFIGQSTDSPGEPH